MQSHAGQRQCGLTSPAADQLVGQVQKAALLRTPGEFPRLYGASSAGHADSGRLSLLMCVCLHCFSSRIAPRSFSNVMLTDVHHAHTPYIVHMLVKRSQAVCVLAAVICLSHDLRRICDHSSTDRTACSFLTHHDAAALPAALYYPALQETHRAVCLTEPASTT